MLSLLFCLLGIDSAVGYAVSNKYNFILLLLFRLTFSSVECCIFPVAYHLRPRTNQTSCLSLSLFNLMRKMKPASIKCTSDLL